MSCWLGHDILVAQIFSENILCRCVWEGVSIWICRLNEVNCPSPCTWASPSPLRAWIEQNGGGREGGRVLSVGHPERGHRCSLALGPGFTPPAPGSQACGVGQRDFSPSTGTGANSWWETSLCPWTHSVGSLRRPLMNTGTWKGRKEGQSWWSETRGVESERNEAAGETGTRLFRAL